MFLVLITIFSTISVAAEPLSDEIKSNQNMSDKIDSDDYSAEYLVEETEKRDENTKYFYMSDGTIQAAQYSVPVHFKQNEKWVDYDNTLIEVDADDSENQSKIVKNKDLTNRTADYSVRLSKKLMVKNSLELKRITIKFLGTIPTQKKVLRKLKRAK